MASTQPAATRLALQPPRIQEAEHRPKSSPSSTGSPGFSTSEFFERPPAPGDPLSEESERIRAGVPDFITDLPPEAEQDQPSETIPQGDPEVIGREEAELRELMDQVAFEEEDVKEQLAELCDWIAESLKADHWRLSDRQKRMVARPLTILLNSLWARLSEFLPKFFAEWCERTPGLFGSVTACTIVFGPKLWKQIEINRQRRRLRQEPPPGAASAPRSSQKPAGGPVGPVQVQDAPPPDTGKGGASAITWN